MDVAAARLAGGRGGGHRQSGCVYLGAITAAALVIWLRTGASLLGRTACLVGEPMVAMR